jgi:L-amino acid N-acyltransferase YncA
VILIREARGADLECMNDIYTQAVLRTTATFDTVPKTLWERKSWFAEHGPAHPVTVAEENGAVLGWASLSRYSDRPAYDRTVENSVYIAENCRGKGIGTALLRDLLDRARKLGHHAVIARIAQDNPASIRLHEAAGFFAVGTLKEVGLKFGTLLDVHVLELLL